MTSNSNIEIILIKYATAVLDAKNGVTNPTLGEMIDPAVEAIQQIIEARMIEFQSSLEEDYEQELLKARINSLLDLEQWIKLHDLGQEMILDGIEHMVKSNLQVPDQPRINHDDRIANLQAKLKGDSDANT